MQFNRDDQVKVSGFGVDVDRFSPVYLNADQAIVLSSKTPYQDAISIQISKNSQVVYVHPSQCKLLTESESGKLKRIISLFKQEHSRCDSVDCEMRLAMNSGYPLVAMAIWDVTGRSSEEFDTSYPKLSAEYRPSGTEYEKQLCEFRKYPPASKGLCIEKQV